MANIQAWQDRQRLLDIYSNCKNALASYVMYSDQDHG
jgi:hypothetical protein